MLSPESFDKEVIESPVPVIVDFYADWCGPCKALAPVLDEVSLEKKIKVVKINVDDCYDITNKMGVRGIPAVFLFENGISKKSFVGTKSKSEILKWIE